MAVRPAVKLTRKQIYDEIWSVAVSGMALKYSIPYSSLMKQIKDANIPVPPSGYWTKKEFNKETTMTPLPGDPDEVIALYKSSATATRMQKNGSREAESPKTASEKQKLVVVPEVEKKVDTKEKQADQTEPPIKASLPQSNPSAALGELEVQASWGGRSLNVYRREVLYKEVWQFPVVEVAKKYAVSDVTIHKICRSLDIPTPPPGYWAKLRAGKEVSIPPLPKSDRRDVITGSRTQKIYTPSTEEQIQHLSEEDRTAVMAVASQIVMVDEQEKMNPKVAACYKKAKAGQTTEILDSIAKETLPRAVKILDTLVKTAIPLGIEIDDKLRFSIGKDSVSLRFSESTTEVPHQLTKEEKMALLEYEDAKKHKRWASEPKIRKYDHIYNGTLSLGINDKRRFRDSKAGLIEERLGEALIRRVYDFPYLGRIFKEGTQNFPVVLPTLDAGGILFPPFIAEGAEILFCFLQCDRSVDFLQVSYQFLDIFVADILSRTTDLVNNATLQPALGIYCLDCLHHATKAVGTEQINIQNAPAFEVIQHTQPKFTALMLADPDTEDIFSAIHGDS